MVACASHNNRVAVRAPVGANRVPTAAPASASVARAARREHHRDARTGGDPSGLDLGDHAAAADAGASWLAEGDAVEVRRTRHVGQQSGTRPARIAVEEALDVGEEHQQVGVDEMGHQRSEPVIVTEPDLVGGDGVVLVHDRHHTEIEQGTQRAVRVAVVAAPDHVVRSEQHLADRQAMPGERRGVPGQEQPLAHAGARLLGGKVARAPWQAKRRQTSGNRPRRHQDDLDTGAPSPGEDVDQGVHPIAVETTGSRRE